MPREKDEDTYSDEETERRATAALRNALSSPFKSHREMVGKTNESSKSKVAKKETPAKP